MALQYQQNDDHDEHTDEQSGLIIDISPALRRRLKRAAAQHDLSVDQYVEDIIEKAVAQEEAKQEESTSEESTEKEEHRSVSLQTIERLRRTREAIMQDRQGQPFSDSTEIIRQMREERSQYLSEL